MPPKGWKKDAQGNYPTTSYIKEQEKITIDDLLFPKATIASLAKEVTIDSGDTKVGDDQKKVVLSKDVVTALQRSSIVFVNHLLMYTREVAHSQDRKSCNVDDVLAALDEVGLGGLKALVRSKLDSYLEALELRKGEKESSKSTAGTETIKKTDKDKDDGDDEDRDGDEDEIDEIEGEEGEEEEEEEEPEQEEENDEGHSTEDDDEQVDADGEREIAQKKAENGK